jgi:hypothetical protein
MPVQRAVGQSLICRKQTFRVRRKVDGVEDCLASAHRRRVIAGDISGDDGYPPATSLKTTLEREHSTFKPNPSLE